MEQKDLNGYTTIAAENDGIYLTVFPPSGKGLKATLSDVQKELQKYNVAVTSLDLLNRIVNEATGKSNKVSDKSMARSQDQVFVEISNDDMSAKITIVPPANENENFPTIDEIRDILRFKNVLNGVDESKMAELAGKLQAVQNNRDLAEPLEMEIAFGNPIINGEDARIEYLYKREGTEEVENVPLEEAEDGRVDYRAAHKIDNVTKGTLLARKIPATKGVAGMTVTGKVIEAKDGKDIDVILGKGVIVSPTNPDEWVADSDGQVIVKDNKISVMALYEINGDVNLSTGNIDFIGTVIVRGDVKDGFKVFTGEDLIINGVVEGAELKCGGKLTIGGGISGNDKAKVSCKNDATVKYIRNSIIDVGGNLTCSQAIMHSKVSVGGKVTVAGKKGVIVGGQIIAGREINAASIGSNFATLTEIIVGEALGLREELQKIESDLKSASENLDKTKKGILFLKELQTKMGGNLPAEKKELLTKLTRAQFKLMADVKNFGEKKQEIEKQEQESAEDRRRHAKVTSMGVIHTGVKITINKASRQITEELKYCTLTEHDGEIKVGPYKG